MRILKFNISTWKSGCPISCEIQMPQTSLTLFRKDLIKFYQGK